MGERILSGGCRSVKDNDARRTSRDAIYQGKGGQISAGAASNRRETGEVDEYVT
jgi:hypothetical protein